MANTRLKNFELPIPTKYFDTQDERDQYICWRAVDKAVRQGLIKPTTKCFYCGLPESTNRRLSAHHYDGYFPPKEKWYKIHWACSSCHPTQHSDDGIDPLPQPLRTHRPTNYKPEPLPPRLMELKRGLNRNGESL